MSGVVFSFYAFATLKSKHRSDAGCDRYLSLAEDYDARNALQIRTNIEQLPNVRIDKLLYSFALVETDLHHQVTVLFEKCRSFLDESTDDAESIGTGRERDERFMIAHLALESRQNSR